MHYSEGQLYTFTNVNVDASFTAIGLTVAECRKGTSRRSSELSVFFSKLDVKGLFILIVSAAT